MNCLCQSTFMQSDVLMWGYNLYRAVTVYGCAIAQLTKIVPTPRPEVASSLTAKVRLKLVVTETTPSMIRTGLLLVKFCQTDLL